MRSILHSRSTLLGILSSLIVAAAIGAATHWQSFFMVVAFVASLSITSRLFYGMRESRDLDAAPIQPGSGFRTRLMDESMENGAELVEAYRKSQMTGVDESGWPVDRSALRKFAAEEQA